MAQDNFFRYDLERPYYVKVKDGEFGLGKIAGEKGAREVGKWPVTSLEGHEGNFDFSDEELLTLSARPAPGEEKSELQRAFEADGREWKPRPPRSSGGNERRPIGGNTSGRPATRPWSENGITLTLQNGARVRLYESDPGQVSVLISAEGDSLADVRNIAFAVQTNWSDPEAWSGPKRNKDKTIVPGRFRASNRFDITFKVAAASEEGKTE